MTNDNTGLLYIGTQQAVRTFDGYQVKPLEYIDESGKLSTKLLGYIIRLRTAPNGDIWIATPQQGLYHYNPRSKQLNRYQAEGNPNRLISSNRTDDIAFMGSKVFVATRKGLDVIDLAANTIKRQAISQDNLKTKAILALAIDQNQQLWIGVRGEGIYRGPLSLEEFKRPIANGDAKGLETTLPYTIFVDRSNGIWVATFHRELFRILDDEAELVESGTTRYRSIAQPNENEIWTSVRDRGIRVYDAIEGTLLHSYRHDAADPNSLLHSDVTSLHLDQSGILWITPLSMDLSYINTRANAFRHLVQGSNPLWSLSGKSVISTFERDNGDIWISLVAKGIDVFDQEKGKVHQYSNSPGSDSGLSPSTSWIVRNSKGQLFVGNKVTFPQIFDEQKQRFEMISPDPEPLFSPPTKAAFNVDDELFLGGRPPYLYNSLENSWKKLTISDPDIKGLGVYALSSDIDGNFWMTNRGKVFYLPKGGTEVQVMNMEFAAGERPDYIRWLGVKVLENQDVYLNNRTDVYKVINRDSNGTLRLELVVQGLYANYSQYDSNTLWEDTARYQIGEKRLIKLDAGYGKFDGEAWETVSMGLRNKTLLFPSPSGVILLKPELFEEWDYQPEVIVSELTVGLEQRNYSNNTIQISPDQDRLEVKFAALDYSYPSLNKYKYKLHGYDKNWQQSKVESRTATYTNLPPDEYELEIVGSNRLGQWSPHSKKLKILVLPAWYETGWARTIFIILILFALYSIYLFRVRMLKANQVVLEATVEMKTAELRNSLVELKETQGRLVASEKQASLGRLTRGMAHELNTPLGVIKMSYSMLEGQFSKLVHALNEQTLTEQSFLKTKTSFENASELLGKNLSRTIDLVASFKKVSSDEDDTSIEQFEIVPIIESTIRVNPETFDFSIEGEKTQAVKSVKAVFIDVLDEIINNALAHGKNSETGQLELSITVSQNESNHIIKITDTGPGLPKEDLERVFDPFYTAGSHVESVGLGLHILYNKVSQVLRGEVKAESSQDSGLCITLIIPSLETDSD